MHPIPIAEVAPRVGGGLTLFEASGARPGTIIRVSTSARCFWFRLDAMAQGPAGEQTFVPDPRGWVYRALQQPDGVFREDHDMKRVKVGIRVTNPRRELPPPGETPRALEDLQDAVERIEPWLLKTRWYPMSYMLIPSVLRDADSLLAELLLFRAADTLGHDEALALQGRLTKARAAFRRTI